VLALPLEHNHLLGQLLSRGSRQACAEEIDGLDDIAQLFGIAAFIRD
jgi:hypothetical protein